MNKHSQTDKGDNATSILTLVEWGVAEINFRRVLANSLTDQLLNFVLVRIVQFHSKWQALHLEFVSLGDYVNLRTKHGKPHCEYTAK